MEKEIMIKNEFKSLEDLQRFLKQASPYEVSIEYDIWDHKTDGNGELEKCILMKKSDLHGMKISRLGENNVSLKYVIPNKMMNALFGASQKKYRTILEIIAEKIKDLVLIGSQKKAFGEMSQITNKMAM